MRGREFLHVSEMLKGNAEEAADRTRISRACYAAFLEARQFCEDHLRYSRRKSSNEHQEVARLLLGVDKDLASRLRFLRGRRNVADYDLDVSHRTIAESALLADHLAHELIARLDSHAERLAGFV